MLRDEVAWVCSLRRLYARNVSKLVQEKGLADLASLPLDGSISRVVPLPGSNPLSGSGALVLGGKRPVLSLLHNRLGTHAGKAYARGCKRQKIRRV